MLRRNLGYKILALALAIFLWFYVSVQQRQVPIRGALSYATVPVVLRSEGGPAPGYRIAGVTVSPPLATIAGEEQRLRRVHHIDTLTVNLDRATADIHRVMVLVPPDDDVTTISEPLVNVTIKIEPAR